MVTELVKSGYKQTEVGIIPEDWDVKPLKMISTINGRIGWQGLKQSEFTPDPNDPFLITGMNFEDGRIRWEEVYHIPLKRYEEATNIQLKLGDVLMTKDGTIGKLLYVDKIPYPGKASLNSHLLVFRPIAGRYVPKFLFYQLSSKAFLDYIELNKSGSTFFGITQEAISNYKAFLPSIREQVQIARALSDIDELSEQLDLLIIKKKNMKQGAMQQLLTGMKRVQEFSRGTKACRKQTEVGILPEDWNVQALGSHVEIRSGESPSQFKFDNDGIPYFKVEQLNNNTKYLQDTPYHFRGEKKVPHNSIIFPKRGASILLNKVRILNQDGFMDTNLMTLTPKISLNPEYLYYALTHIQLWKIADTTSIPQINNKHIIPLLIPFPPLSEQSAIAAVLSDMDAELTALEQRRDKIHDIKKGMTQQLMTGRVRLR